MKLLTKTLALSILFIGINTIGYSQVTTIGNAGVATDYMGWNALQPFPLVIEHQGNFPIRIRTDGINRGQWTTGNFLGLGLMSTVFTGDGLRIFSPSGPGAELDLWTSTSNTTHIKFDGSGAIHGQANRFEYWANRNGFWYNTTTSTGRYIFNRGAFSLLHLNGVIPNLFTNC